MKRYATFEGTLKLRDPEDQIVERVTVDDSDAGVTDAAGRDLIAGLLTRRDDLGAYAFGGRLFPTARFVELNTVAVARWADTPDPE